MASSELESDVDSEQSSTQESETESEVDSEISSEHDIEPSKFASEMHDCLADVKSAGSFSMYQHSTSFPNPGLHINGIGIIPLPLSEHDAKIIAARSRQAPFGKGDQTVVDTTVRKTWELNSSDFEFQNPSWGPYFQQLADHAVVGLGVEVSVRAEKYKLLLYEDGAFFKSHKDSEKVPGMFGTLVICLPSAHKGGEIYLSHAGKKKVLTTETTSQFDLSALAWYSDVTHEIRPVTSGNRLVATFNLVETSHKTGTQSANALSEKQKLLESLLRQWRKNFLYHEKFVYILEHQYTESSLRLHNLKGQDRALGQHLRDVCSPNGFHLFFAQLEKATQEEDYCDEDDEEFISLDHVVTPDGLEVATSCNIEENEILQEDPFDRDADSEDEGEYTGNENTPATLRYHNTVAIIVPKEMLFEVFKSSLKAHSSPTGNLINYVCALSHENSADQALRAIALKITKTAITKPTDRWNYQSSAPPQGQFCATVARWALLFDDSNLVSQMVEDGISKNGGGADAILGELIKFVNENLAQECLDWDKWFSSIPSAIKSLMELQRSLLKFETGLSISQHKISFHKWAIAKIDQRLASQDLEPGDCPVVLAMIEARSSNWALNSLLPLLSTNAAEKFIKALLKSLFSQRTKAAFNSVAPEFYRYFMLNNTPELTLKADDFGSAPTRYPPNSNTLHINDFFTLMENALSLGLKSEVIAIINRSEAELRNNKELTVHHTHMPYLINAFMAFAGKHKECMPNLVVKDLFVDLLERTINNLRNCKPQEPQNWAQKPKNCHNSQCDICIGLARFLTDPSQKVGRFTMALERRKHISNYLYGDHYILETEKYRSPHTLIVTKTRNEYNEDLAKWKREVAEVEQCWESLRTEHIQCIFGERYEDLILLANVHGGPVVRSDEVETRLKTTQRQTLNARTPQNLNARGVSQIARTKRKAVVIDLVDSD